VEIFRFGPGFRRPGPATGTQGLASQTIWSDPRARVTELAFARHAVMAPQSSPDAGLLIVVSGGGWVQVGGERAAINHGEAVEWPAGVAHAAWTDGSQMRALLVEVPEQAIAAGHERLARPSSASHPVPVRGSLAAREVRPEDHDPAEGEPW
jgi:quercetin dioxygenase-like cupin family protein